MALGWLGNGVVDPNTDITFPDEDDNERDEDAEYHKNEGFRDQDFEGGDNGDKGEESEGNDRERWIPPREGSEAVMIDCRASRTCSTGSASAMQTHESLSLTRF
ncbi:hypothetical protein S40285_10086 [Stachybotrys chlorohalonatus IBT 40285]|uniref:Uncharacterized protein n=1 Tax=Stachybotrys chlorohalonatus (strain IBT 40285) TaxID=1283841 RepID=A0A084QGX2_STAC4|nr:hypothetical protein S40285_10086 [Stachybotrys chlorohalonata IBT 40285]